MNTSGYMAPKRGEVWGVDLEPTQGSEIHNHGATARPCVVLSDDRFASVPVRTVVPLTEWQQKFDNKATMVKLVASQANGLTKDSGANASQVRTVDLGRFKSCWGRVTADEIEATVLAVGIIIGHP